MVAVDPGNLPRSGSVRAFDKGQPVVALVLSGGAARGYAQIGVIRALEQMGIETDLMVGTSAGGIVGAGYAAGAGQMGFEDRDWIVRRGEVAGNDAASPLSALLSPSALQQPRVR